MGGCLSRSSFTVNKSNAEYYGSRSQPIVFSVLDTEVVLRETEIGTYLLYKDIDTEKIYLSVMAPNHKIRHHRIMEIEKLFYLEKQPYPYLDSIILYHRKHKLRGVKLTQRAHLSARVVKAFTTKVTENNGNYLAPPSAYLNVSWHGSTESLITSSSAAS
ncbi:hypothetical protein LOTGIDRAFT_160565 [Lottia gigantea]|uniref:SH2 domain-containing protein n=1 Tax=Lottia gigantea TaxID=225164 RepID=V4AL22_LOTGI|nr:hypothetical protein LOTGIDRAFT_160565 [Lottia gigantea]ESO95425.1 hypothetical protein LOTGIDRAFT_160565 [Lottia gigantea]